MLHPGGMRSNSHTSPVAEQPMRTRHILEDSKESRHDHDPTCTNRPWRPLPQSAPCGWHQTSFRDRSVYMEHAKQEEHPTAFKRFCSFTSSSFENLAVGKDWPNPQRDSSHPTQPHVHTSKGSQRTSSNWPTNTVSKKSINPFTTNRGKPNARYRSSGNFPRCSTHERSRSISNHQSELRPPARIPSIGVDRLRCDGGSTNARRCTAYRNHHAGLPTRQATWPGLFRNPTDHHTYPIHKGLRP